MHVDSFIGFFLTPVGAMVSGVCTIASLLFGFFQASKVTNLNCNIKAQNSTITTLQADKIELTQKVNVLNNSNNKLNMENAKLSHTINSLSESEISSIHQNGKTNFNAKTVKGGITFEVS